MAENIFAQLADKPRASGSGNIFAQLADEPRASGLDPESEGWFQEIIEGVGSGLTKIPQGILELGATGIDLVAGTQTADAVTETFEDFREAAGLDPVGFMGKGAELITQFGVPGGAGVKALNALVKARKLKAGGGAAIEASKLKNLAMQSAAAGATDLIVATNDTESVIEGFWDGGSGPESEAGLSNRKKALENIKDRLFLGVEGAIAVPAAIGAFKVGKKILVEPAQQAGQAVAQSSVGKPVLEGGRALVQQGAKTLLKGASNVSDSIARLDETVLAGKASPSQDLLSSFLGGLRYRGRLPFAVGLSRGLNKQGIKIDMTRAEANATLLEKDLQKISSQLDPDASLLGRESAEKSIRKYLEAEPDQLNKIYDELPTGVDRKNLDSMRKHVLDLSKSALEESALLNESVQMMGNVNLRKLITESIAGNKGYLRRDYEIHRNTKYAPTKDAQMVANKFFRTGGKAMAEDELTQAAIRNVPGVNELDFTNPVFMKEIGATAVTKANAEGAQEIVGLKFLNGVNDQAAEAATKSFLERHSFSGARNVEAGRIGSVRLNTDMLLERKNIAPELREVMGEISNPTQAYVQTISDLANFKAADTFFDDIRKAAESNTGIGTLFRKSGSLNDAQKANLRKQGYVELGAEKEGSSFRPGELGDDVLKDANLDMNQLDQSGWGVLNGYMVPKQIYTDLTVHKVGNSKDFWDIAARGLSGAMKVKGVTQYSKTVLSPVTQVRNLTSASMFALMQGNLGRGASLKESFDIVFKNMRNSGDEAMLKELAEMQSRGIIGTSANLREIQELLSGYGAPSFKGFSKGPVQRAMNKKVGVGEYKASAKDFTTLMDKLYQGSDDGWKIYNYKFEQNKLRSALNDLSIEDKYRHLSPETPVPSNLNAGQVDELIKDRAGQIVRDTVPNYDVAPSLIRGMRKLPFGNFVTFPYEVYRTGFNTVDQALKELASDIPAVQNIGMRRASGVLATTIMVPTATVQAGMLATGIGKDQIEAYKRSFGAPWEKYATLVPIGVDKKGNPQFINFSTFNPYNDIAKLMKSGMDSFATSKRHGKRSSEALAGAMFTSMAESMKPFMEFSMSAKAIKEGNPFGSGMSDTGAKIFSPADSWADKVKKGGIHMANTAIPNILPFEGRGGEIVPRKFIRGILGSEDGFIDSMDKQGNEYGMDKSMALGMLGFRPITFDPEKNIRYKGLDIKKQQSEAKQKFTSLADDRNINSEGLLQGYIKANIALQKADEKMFQMFEDGKALGLSRFKIKNILEKNNVTGVDRVSRGLSDPYKVSSQIKNKMRRFGIMNQFPSGDIAKAYQQFKKEKLTKDPEFTPAKPVAPLSREPVNLYRPQAQAPTSQPVGNPFAALNTPNSAPPVGNPFAALNTPSNRVATPPSLLGNNPQNIEIANRLG